MKPINLNNYDILDIDDIQKETKNTIMYDIEVEDDNTFYISKNQKDNILVHNCDGNHIKGLLINLFDNFWPELLDMDFLYEFITPLIKIEKGGRHRYFYRLDDYKRWKIENDSSGWYVKWYKGLGTIQSQESKLFFKSLDKHLVKFNTDNKENRNDLIDMVFNKKRPNDRKDWLTSYIPNIEIDKFKTKQTYEKFINNELIEFSMADNLRSIPNVIDGLKPSQRKVLYTMIKRNFKDQIKVSSLSGSVTELTAYHHGNISMEGTIVGMAQDFINSNNINLLEPKGQFGTRLKGGRDSSASRYIFTKLNPVTRHIFKKEDDNLLNYLNDDGYKIEPDFYIPIIPMVLVNGSYGIGSGWMSDIPKYSPTDIITFLTNKINNKRINIPLYPHFNGFKGSISFDEKLNRFVTRGIFEKVNSTTINITELPIGTWNDKYYDTLDKLIEDKIIKDYVKNCTDIEINITIDISRENMKSIIDSDPYKVFSLESYFNINNMYLFDENYKLVKFDSPYGLINYFYERRLVYYEKRKSYLIEQLEKEKQILYNRIKFINLVITNKITIHKQTKEKIESQLTEHRLLKINDSYDYLLTMMIYSLTKEKMIELKNSYDKKKDELERIKNTEVKTMWLEDLKELKTILK